MYSNASHGTPPVKIKIASTGDVFDVPDDKSVLQVLIGNGYLVESSCTSGLCGMCRVRYLEGEVDHQDLILTDQEQSEYLTTCISRPISSEIVLDLPPPGTAPTETVGVEGIMNACPKLLMNGPCGGSERGMCEVDTSIPCVWAKTWENSEELGLMDMFLEIQPPKDWSTSQGGLRRKADPGESHQPKAARGETHAGPGSQTPETEPEPASSDPGAEDRENAFLKEFGLA